MAMTPKSLLHPTNFIDCLRKAELEDEQRIASLKPGTPLGKSELEDLDSAVENARFYDDTELDRLQEKPEYEDWKREQDQRIEREKR